MATFNMPRLGSFSGLTASWVDRQYLHPGQSWFGKACHFVKVRAGFLASFPLLALIDAVGGGFLSGYYRIRSLWANKETEQMKWRKQAGQVGEMAFRNAIALLTFPLGIISPKLVALHFIPSVKSKQVVHSGGDLYQMRTSVAKPATTEELKEIIQQAQVTNQKIAIIGAGMSQGKQFMPADDNCIAINMKRFNKVHVNPDSKTAVVGAGATWGDIQAIANQHKLAVKVMQASNVFSVGGSISTNIHGWHKAGILANTLKSVTVMDADGRLKKYTPRDRAFGFIVGGLGQFGVIVEAEISLTRNRELKQQAQRVSIGDYVRHFRTEIKANKHNKMHLFRLSIDPGALLSEGVSVNYLSTDNKQSVKTKGLTKEPAQGARLERNLVNLARRFPWLRKLYWLLEKKRLLNSKQELSTNNIMHPPVNAMFNNATSESEWLQEFFIPGEHLEAFLNELGPLLMRNQVNLLNATVRYVDQDNISKMGYANQGERFAVVLCFNQSLAKDEVMKTKQWVRQAIDKALSFGGTYYLPYQHFASHEQFAKAYPTYQAVVAEKAKMDKNHRFASGFANEYLNKTEHPSNRYRLMLADESKRALFGQFLDNVLYRVDKEKLFALLTDITGYCDTNDEIYLELQRRLPTIMPGMVATGKRIYQSLNSIKQDLTNQAADLLSNVDRPIQGMIEIGYPGRFVNTFKSKLNVQGPITVVDEQETLSGYIQSGFPRPYQQFVPLNDYAPLPADKCPENSVDLVTCFIGLHHIPENKLDDFLQSIRRALRPGGSLLLVDHDIQNDTTREMADMAHSVYNAVMGFSLQDEQSELRHFKSLADWQAILQRNGFDVEMSGKSPKVRAGDPTHNSMIRLVKRDDLALAHQPTILHAHQLSSAPKPKSMKKKTPSSRVKKRVKF